ncbi:hypothetical protein ACFL5Q_04480 [Planctomycetota bacterium]
MNLYEVGNVEVAIGAALVGFGPVTMLLMTAGAKHHPVIAKLRRRLCYLSIYGFLNLAVFGALAAFAVSTPTFFRGGTAALLLAAMLYMLYVRVFLDRKTRNAGSRNGPSTAQLMGLNPQSCSKCGYHFSTPIDPHGNEQCPKCGKYRGW